MRWGGVCLALLLASVACAQGALPGEPPEGPLVVQPRERLPMEPDAPAESHAGHAIVADGELAVVAGVGDCNQWDDVLFTPVQSCSRNAPSKLRLYARDDDWDLVAAVTITCAGYYTRDAGPLLRVSVRDRRPAVMDLEDGVVAVAQPCVSDLLGSLLDKEGAVRILSFGAGGVTEDVTLGSVDPLRPDDLLRPETFGTHVQVDGGTVYVASVGGERPDGGDEPHLLIPYRRDGGAWRAGTPYQLDVGWTRGTWSTPFLVEDGWLALHDAGAWRFLRLEGGGRLVAGPTIPGPRAPVALEGDRFAVAGDSEVRLYRNSGVEWLPEGSLPVAPTEDGPTDAVALAVSPDRVAVGRPGPYVVPLAGHYGHYDQTGSVSLWGWNEGAWTRTVEFQRRGGLGEAVALAGPDLLMGAPDGDGGSHGPPTSSGYRGIAFAADLPDAPTAGFRVDRESDLSRTPVTFRSDATDSDGDIAWFGWDVGDDGVLDGFGRRWDASFPRAGSIPVRLTVVDETGLRDSTVQTVEVDNRPPVADFGPGDGVVFRMAERTVFDRSRDPDGDVVSWQWTASDGQSHDGREPTFLFEELGPVEVTLEVTDNQGATSTRTATVLVVNHPPVVEISHTPPGLTGEPVTLTVTVQDPDGVVERWRWLDEGAPTGPGAEEWTRTWETPGLKTVAAAAWDNEGGESVARVTLEVGNRPPDAFFLLPPRVPVGTHVVPEDRSEDPDGRIRSWEWHLGDDRDPVHDPLPRLSWDAPGQYVVHLRVVDAHGASDQYATTVTVGDRPPTAHITSYWDPATGEHVVSDASTDPDGDIRARQWRVDGVLLETTGESLRLPGGGTIRLDLRVEDDDGLAAEARTYLSPPIEPPGPAPEPEGGGGAGGEEFVPASRATNPPEPPETTAALPLGAPSWPLWVAVACAGVVAGLASWLFWRRDDVA